MKPVYCSLFGHDYKVSKNITHHIKEYKCKNCTSEMTINSDGKFIPLTPKFREINSVLNHIHLKRLKRKQKLFTTNS